MNLWFCADRRDRIAYEGRASAALCGKTRPDCLRGPCVCGLVRKDEAVLGRKAEHLRPCAERRGQIAKRAAKHPPPTAADSTSGNGKDDLADVVARLQVSVRRGCLC